jgi:hypothetical protein
MRQRLRGYGQVLQGVRNNAGLTIKTTGAGGKGIRGGGATVDEKIVCHDEVAQLLQITIYFCS